MNFGLEDIRNNTVLGTPICELSSIAEELKKGIEQDVSCEENNNKDKI